MDYENIPGEGRGGWVDGDGGHTRMVPEPAAAAVAPARTGGKPLVADANGTIVLPAGATLDDIKVVGRDLVITLDNGQVFVIPEGAVYVPQIVIDGVAVPPLNLAALLIGEEPIQPAAGFARSSGNNFFEAAGPIQTARSVGDLLPPTEFALAAEPFEEVIPQLIDRDPFLGIITANQAVAISDATATVSESGLPARGAEPAGSNAAANTETTGGTIVFSSPDGITSLTINGVSFTAAGQTFTSPRGTLTITTFDTAAGTANFTYALTDNLVGGTVADQFSIVLTDADGDSATSTLTIAANDDAPIARNDTDAVPAGTFTAQTGNVLTGVGATSGAAGADTLGADNASITRIASNTIAASTDTSFDPAGNLQVSGQYGVLTIRADGGYAYTRNPGTPGGVSDGFTYTLTDADGSASTATLTIALADAAPVITALPVAGSAATVVAESGLPARPGEAPGSNASAPTETATGTITFTAGDGPVTATINGVTVAVGAVVSTPSGTLTVTSFDPAGGTIGYTFTLADNTVGDATSVTFNVVVTDVDGDSASGAFAIAITDDVPLAVNGNATQAGENAAITVNALGNGIQGADSVALSAVAAVPGSLSGTGSLVYNADGTFTYTPGAGEQGTVTFDYTITDGDGDSSRATVTIVLLADSSPTVTVAGDSTVSEAALPARGDEPAGSNTVSPDETASGTIGVATGGDTLASLVINGVNVTGGGTVTTAKGVLIVSVANGVYSYSYTLADNTLSDPDSDTFAIVVTDSDGDATATTLVFAIADDTPTARNDAGALTAGTYGPISGNVTANDTPGADGIAVLSYAGVTSGNAGATVQGQYGTLTIAANGAYSYTRDAGAPGGVSDSFAYTVRDGDGDLATANLVIAIPDSGVSLTIPPAGAPGSTQVLEAALPAGSAAATNGEFASGSFSFNAPDGPATVVIGGTTVTAVGQTIAGSFGTLTITGIASGSIGYTYQLTTTTSGDAVSEAFAVSVTDKDGDASTGSLSFAIVDDVPTARADADSVVEDGPPIADGNVITGSGGADANATDGVADTRGADGASVSAVSFGNTAGTVGIALAGAYGTLTLNADGNYSYALNNANPLVQGLDKTQTLTDAFGYTLRDGDGDTSPTTLIITINGADDGVTLTGLDGAGGEQTVLEANLAAGSAPNAAALTKTGSFTAVGQDGIATIVVGGKTVFAGGAFVPGQSISNDHGTLTIIAVTPIKDAAGDTVSATVSYSYTLNSNTAAHTGANGEQLADSFAVTVIDTDGSAATNSLDIVVVDDAPIARADADSVAGGGPTIADGNVITGSGGADANATDGVADTRGADGSNVSAVGFGVTVGGVGAPLAGAYGSLTLNADGSYSYVLDSANPLVAGLDKSQTLTETFAYTLRDGDGDTGPSTLTITIVGADDGVTISGLAMAGGEITVSEANLFDGSSPNAGALTQTGSFSTAGVDGIATIVVGGKTVFTGGAFVAGQSVVTAQGTLTITGVAPVKDAAGDTVSGIVSYSYTLGDNTLAHGAAGNDAAVASFAVTVTDTDGSQASGSLDVRIVDDTPTASPDTITVGEGGSTTGNVLTDGADDVFGADGATTTVPAGGVFLVNGAAPGTPIVTALGTLTLRADGSYTYVARPDTIAADAIDNFTYAIRDADGDVSQTTLAITVKAVNGVVADTDVDVDESGLATIGSQAAPDGEFDTNGQITITGATGPFTYTLTATPPTPYGTLTLDAATGAYSYTLTRPFDNADANDGRVVIDAVESYGYRVTDQFGNVVGNGSIQVNVRDDAPTAFADAAITVAEDGANVGGNLLTNDAQGADGATVTAVTVGGITTAVAPAGTTTVTTTAGGYSFQANGAWSFDPAPDQSNGAAATNAGFTYTITDGDGDKSSAAQAIIVTDGTNPIAGTAITLTVDDENLVGGTNQSAIQPVTSAGTITFTPGSDTIASIAFDTVLTSLNSSNLTWTRESAVQIVGRDTGRGMTVVTLDLVRSGNSATVTATLSNNYDAHPTLGDDLVALGSVNVVATDSDGDFVTTAVNLRVSDDVPDARNDSAIQGAENAAIVIDALANDIKGADGLNAGDPTKVFVVAQPAQGVVTYDTATGKFTYTPDAGAGSASSSDQFSYRLVDGDGDFDEAVVSITLKPDSAPVVKTTTSLRVDEDGFAAHNPDGDALIHPPETAGSNSLADGSGSAVVNFANDVPSNLLAAIALVDLPGYDTQLRTLDGAAVTFGIESGALVGRSGGAEVIRIAITGAAAGPLAGDVTYTYSTTLSQPVKHVASGEDTVTLSGVTFQVTDRDSDTATGSFNVAILDDVPAVDVRSVFDVGVVVVTYDVDTAGAQSDAESTGPNFSGVISAVSVASADGAPAPAMAYVLNLSGQGANTGLTSHAKAIFVYKIGAAIFGSTATSVALVDTANPVFKVSVSGTGAVTLTQYEPIDHGTAQTGPIYSNDSRALVDSLVTLTATATVTDRDGDSASDSLVLPIGANLRFADDGPSLSNVAAGAAVSVDETAAGANFAAPVTMTSATAAITAAAAFGADGAAASGATSYGLKIAGGGATTLKTAIGDQAIVLAQTSATTITGQYGAGLTAFTLTITANGTLKLTQNVALEHNQDGATAADHNDALTLAGLVNATITIKDFDGDTATASAAIGGNVTFLDDGVLVAADVGSVPTDSAVPITGNVLANDYRGADGSAITAVINGGANTGGTLAAGVFAIQGQYGALTVDASTGAYTYVHTAGAGGGASDTFTYTLTDNDGDSAATTLTIGIGDPPAGPARAMLGKLEAITAELTATNAAAAGILAAAGVAALPVAAAEVAPAAAPTSEETPPVALLSLPEVHETLREIAAPGSHVVEKATPAQSTTHGDEAPASASSLAALADHATSPASQDIAEHVAIPLAAAPIDFGGDASQLMNALLAAAQAVKGGVVGAGQHPQDLAAVQDAFGDSHGAALVDAMVDHFAGVQAMAPGGGDSALAELFASHVGGSASFGPAYDINQMLSDLSAHAAAQG